MSEFYGSSSDYSELNKIISNSVYTDVSISSNSVYKSVGVEEYSFDNDADVEDVSTTTTAGKDNYFVENTSDYDKININSFNNHLTNELKEKLGRNSDAYIFLCKYLEGKKLRDVLDEEGHIVIPDEELQKLYDSIYVSPGGYGGLSDETRQMVVNKLKDALKTTSMGEYSGTILDSTICEIVSDQYGFDAIVYEKDGEYCIANTCADGQSQEDILLIIYSALYSTTGSDDAYDYFSPFFSNINGGLNLEEMGYNFDYKDIAKAKEIYNHQRQKSYEMLKKYSNMGNVSLEGYSMGGGIQFDSYLQLIEDNPEKAKNIHLELYNPYIGFLEGNSDYMDGDNLIDGKRNRLKEILKDYSDNIHIFAAEGDVVSQFNSLTDCLADNFTYLKGNSKIDYSLPDNFQFTDILNLIFGEDSRHSLEGFDSSDTYFDNNGNVISSGKQITINEVAGGNYKSNSLSSLITNAFEDNLTELKKDLMDFDLGDANYAKDGISVMYDDLLNYLKNNVGNITSDGFLKALSPGLAEILKEGARKQAGSDAGSWVIDQVANNYLTDDEIYNGLKDYLSKADTENVIDNLIGEMVSGNFNNISTVVTKIGTDVYWESLEKYHPYRYDLTKNLEWYGPDLGKNLSNIQENWNLFTQGFSDGDGSKIIVGGLNVLDNVGGMALEGLGFVGKNVWDGVCTFFGF